MKSIYSLILILTLSISGCNTPQQTAKLEHDINPGTKPWNGEDFEQTEEEFTFAIISDLTGKE